MSLNACAALVERGNLAAVPAVAKPMPVWGDSDASTEAHARAYLDVNCAHCHRPGGGASNSGLDLRWEQDDPFAIGVRKPPVAAGRGAGGLLVSIAPGEPEPRDASSIDQLLCRSFLERFFFLDEPPRLTVDLQFQKLPPEFRGQEFWLEGPR